MQALREGRPGLVPGALAGVDYRGVANKALLLGLILYFVVFGYLVERSVQVKTLEPYGVNIVAYSALLIVAEAILTVTIIWLFAVERSVWPAYARDAVLSFRTWNPLGWLRGLGLAVRSAWNLSILDLRLTSRLTLWLARVNRFAAALPLVYLLAIGYAGLSVVGLTIVSADIAITLGLWAALEAFAVDRQAIAAHHVEQVRRNRLFRMAGRITAGPARMDEAEQIQRIEALAWGEEHARAVEVYRTRIQNYPRGVLVARGRSGRVLSVIMATPYDVQEVLRRKAINFDTIANRFGGAPGSRALWGITFSVPQRYAATGAGTAATLELYKLLVSDFRDFYFGSRIPDYPAMSDQFIRAGVAPPSYEAYAKLTVADVRVVLGQDWGIGRKGHELADKELEYYRALSFRQVRVEPAYYLRDEPPVGIIMVRHNPLAFLPRWLRALLITVAGALYLRATLYGNKEGDAEAEQEREGEPAVLPPTREEMVERGTPVLAGKAD